MAIFLHHTNCPHCGSRDNLGIYDDGSKWCFGCGYWERPTKFVPFVPKSSQSVYSLPPDSDDIIPTKPWNWLKTYGITQAEIKKYGFLYSKQRELLIFPDKDSKGNLLMWQGRYFGSNTEHPKYLTYGAKDHVTICDENSFPNGSPSSDRIVIVEDKLSAIKIGRLVPSCPLYGSTMSLEHARRLAKTFKLCTLWLDSDKYRESLKMAQTYSFVFSMGITVKTTNLDPKAYDEQSLAMTLDLL